jgi:hypothetical protein
MTKQKKALIVGGVLLLGERMTSNEFKYYGLIGGELQIKAFIYMACEVINPSTAEKARKLLAETVAVESKNGKAKDYSGNYGEGLTQFDKGTFEAVKKRFKESRYDNLYDNIKLKLFVDIREANYEDLRKSPMLSIVYARLLYYTFSSPIPEDFNGRWEYYKKYFNSVLGATTKEKYVNASRIAVYGGVNV